MAVANTSSLSANVTLAVLAEEEEGLKQRQALAVNLMLFRCAMVQQLQRLGADPTEIKATLSHRCAAATAAATAAAVYATTHTLLPTALNVKWRFCGRYRLLYRTRRLRWLWQRSVYTKQRWCNTQRTYTVRTHSAHTALTQHTHGCSSAMRSGGC